MAPQPYLFLSTVVLCLLCLLALPPTTEAGLAGMIRRQRLLATNPDPTKLLLPAQPNVSVTRGKLQAADRSAGAVYSQIVSNELASFIAPEMQLAIAREVALASDTTSHHFSFWVTPVSVDVDSATASWVAVKSHHVAQHQVHVEWFRFVASANFPRPQDLVHRERRGSRRWLGIAGPRDRDTWTEYVPRGLTANEIQQVEAFLQEGIYKHPLYLEWAQ